MDSVYVHYVFEVPAHQQINAIDCCCCDMLRIEKASWSYNPRSEVLLSKLPCLRGELDFLDGRLRQLVNYLAHYRGCSFELQPR